MQKKTALVEFIEAKRTQGIDDKEIRHQLLNAGWQMDLVEHAMKNTPGQQSGQTSRPPAVGERLEKLRTIAAKPHFWVGIFLLLVLAALFI